MLRFDAGGLAAAVPHSGNDPRWRGFPRAQTPAPGRPGKWRSPPRVLRRAARWCCACGLRLGWRCVPMRWCTCTRRKCRRTAGWQLDQSWQTCAARDGVGNAAW